MYVVPTLDDFENDILTIYISDAYFVRVVLIDEYIEFSGRPSTVRGVLIEASITLDGTTATIQCPSVIGLKNDIVSLVTDDPSMLGVLARADNIGKWGLEIVE